MRLFVYRSTREACSRAGVCAPQGGEGSGGEGSGGEGGGGEGSGRLDDTAVCESTLRVRCCGS